MFWSMLDESEKHPQTKKCVGMCLLNTRTYASVNIYKGSVYSCLKLLYQYRTIKKMYKCARYIFKLSLRIASNESIIQYTWTSLKY